MAKPTLIEVYNALGVLERAGMLESMQMKWSLGTANTFTAVQVAAELSSLQTKPQPNPKPMKKKKRRISSEQADQAVEMYNSGDNLEYIAKTLGFPADRIARKIGVA